MWRRGVSLAAMVALAASGRLPASELGAQERSDQELPTETLPTETLPVETLPVGERSGRADVRELELMVSLELGRGVLRRTWPRSLSPRDFEVVVDDLPAPVLALDEASEDSAAEPWQLVVYVDTALSSEDLVRSSTGLLAASAGDLVSLGSVEVVVADPDPRILLAATRDAARLENTLAGLSLRPAGSDELTVLRRQAASLEAGEQKLLRAALSRERAIVRRQSDRLISWLARVAERRPRRALFWVSGGYDLDSTPFYRALGASSAGAEDAEARLDAMTAGLARGIAAGKWITFGLRLPEPDPLPRRWDLVRSLLVRLDGNWDPELAEAYLELGESLIGQRKWSKAEAALRSASYHFYGQPKLRPRQALAMARLAHVLEQQGRQVEAAKVAAKAVELDPRLAAEIAPAGLLDPLPPIAAVADATSGGLVWDEEGLDEAIAGLRRRLNLVVEVPPEPRGEPVPISIAYVGPGFEASTSRWVRRGPPAVVAAARSRRLLDDDLDLAPDAAHELSPADWRAICTFSGSVADVGVLVDPGLGEAWEGLSTRIRLTVSTWSGDATPEEMEMRTVQTLSEEQAWKPGRTYAARARLPISIEEPSVAVIVEEMTTEGWFATLLPCEER